MESTLEVRWFHQGAVPAVVAAWFARLEPGAPTEREDVYLAPTGPDLSVKLRGRRIQVKRRRGDGRTVQFTPRAAGCSERWEKFSFRLKEHPPASYGGASGRWIPVKKERLQHVYAPAAWNANGFDGSGAHTEIELTRVRIGDARWWTLCLEAVGAPEALPSELQRAGTHLFTMNEAPVLREAHAQGYPQWLRRIVPRVDANEAARSAEQQLQRL